MKISEQTIALLQQFAAISPGIVISPGNVIFTFTPEVAAEATVPETFPYEIRISDIREFARVIALFRDPVYELEPDLMRIIESDGTAETVFAFSKPGSIRSVHTLKKKKPLPSEHISLSIGREHWETLRKALAIGISRENSYDDGHLKINSDGKTVRLIADRYSRTQKLEYSVSVPAMTNDLECAVVLSAHHLPSLPGPYEATVFPTFVEFQQSCGYSLTYYVSSVPQVSTWGGMQVYQVKVTNTLSQECSVSVNAHSPQEAEALVRKAGTFDWTGEPRPAIECKAVVRN